MKKIKTKDDVFRNIDETLSTAKHGLDFINNKNPQLRMVGLRNLIVFGRAVTNALQNLKSVVSDFDLLYDPVQKEMKDNLIMKTIYQMRSEILKEGKLNVKSHTVINSISMNDLGRIPKPKGAKSFFMGDQFGGDGWDIELADGSTEKYYIKLPSNFNGHSTLSITLCNSEKSFDILKYSNEYYLYLDSIVRDAKSRFLD